jgi:hypothetical protein
MGRTAWTWVLPLALAGAGATAAAHPPPLPEPVPVERPAIEWSTWFRVGFGPRATPAADVAARVVSPPPPDRGWRWDAALGADLTLGVTASGHVRIGPWIETRGLASPAAGGELLIGASPARLDMFFNEGEGVWIVRAGGNRDVVTGAIAWGYRCPWKLWGPWHGTTRYMIGVRLVATATRSIADPGDWSMTFGLETEPVGALRYLLGIRSWY